MVGFNIVCRFRSNDLYRDLFKTKDDHPLFYSFSDINHHWLSTKVLRLENCVSYRGLRLMCELFLYYLLNYLLNNFSILLM